MELLVPTTGPIHTPSTHLPYLYSSKTPLLPAKTLVISLKKTHHSNTFSPPIPNAARKSLFPLHASASSSLPSFSSSTAAVASPPSLASSASSPSTHWIVVMEKPPIVGSSKSEIVNYYVETLARVLGSEKEAQMCMYDAAWQTHFGFCCDIDEVASRELARLPGVLSVKPDIDFESTKKDIRSSNRLLDHLSKLDGHTTKFTPSGGNSNYWLVRIEKPGVEIVTKAQMVDYYAQALTKVLGNEKDAQMCIYNISWEKDFGFCCHIDEQCARELVDVPGVLAVRPDMNFDSANKDYGGDDKSQNSETNQMPSIKTKRLFVTGLSFYTSEKTLRAAFEGFGELVEVKVIMDKISKRSKGYAFIEYTTEEAAGAALKEMNGKIINGWMIVVDVAKTNPPRYSRERPWSSSSPASSY